MSIELFDINNDSTESPSIKYQDLTVFHRHLSHLLKSAKFHVLKLINKQYQKVESKLKIKNEASKEVSKLKHKKEEIEFLESANLDSLAKIIFANKYSEEDLDRIGDKMSLENRIVVRLSNFIPVKAELRKFRSEHLDWEKLAEDLMYKNTGGRIKNSKTKKQGAIPLANGMKESDALIQKVNNLKDEPRNDAVLQIPILEAKKKKEESMRKKKEINRKKEIENQKAEKLAEESLGLQISEDAICEYIKNEDDLDEWEKNVENDEDDEIDLMAPLDGSKTDSATGGKKRSGKAAKRQTFGAKKTKTSSN